MSRALGILELDITEVVQAFEGHVLGLRVDLDNRAACGFGTSFLSNPTIEINRGRIRPR